MKIRGARLRVTVCAVLATLGTGTALRGQAPELRATKTVPIAGMGPVALLNDVKCDANGDLYFRVMPPNNPDPLRAPVVEVSPSGKRKAVFSLASVTDNPAVQKGDIADFAVTQFGEVVLLVSTRASKGGKGKNYLVDFNDDGSYGDLTKLPSDLWPLKFVMFPDSESLISGMMMGQGGEAGRASLAVFDAQGRFAKEVEVASFKKLSWSGGSFDGAATAIKPLSLGLAVLGDDGDAYLLPRTAKPSVMVIAPSGSVVRTISLDVPGPGFKAGALRVAGGMLAVKFYRHGPGKGSPDVNVYQVYDSSSGKLLAAYGTPPEFGTALGCFSPPDSFSFLSQRAGQEVLVHASPH